MQLLYHAFVLKTNTKDTISKETLFRQMSSLNNVLLRQLEILKATYMNTVWSTSSSGFFRSRAKLSTFVGRDKDRVGQTQIVDFWGVIHY